MRKWKKRYVALKAGSKLQFFTGVRDSEPDEEYRLSAFLTVISLPPKKNEYAFQLVPKDVRGTTIVLSAKSQGM